MQPVDIYQFLYQMLESFHLLEDPGKISQRLLEISLLVVELLFGHNTVTLDYGQWVI